MSFFTAFEKLKAEQQRISKELGIQFSNESFIIGTVSESGFKFTTPDKFRSDFAKCVKKAELPKEVTPHALRKYTSCILIRKGASPVAVAKLLGHSSSATTLKIYDMQATLREN